MKPFFSIIVPVYNVEKYLDRCINSLVAQEFSDCEILLVDDGSEDRSGIICDSWTRNSKLVRVFHKQNGGLASARNYGLERASGRYILFCDSDDWIEKGTLDLVKNLIDETDDIDIVKYGYKKIYNGAVLREYLPLFQERIYNRKEIEEAIIPGMLGPEKVFDYSKTPILSACACAYSKRFLDDVKTCFQSEREYLNEDELFNISLILRAKRVRVIRKALYCYDTREGSLTQKYMPYMLERKKKLLDRIEKELKANGLYEQYKTCYYNYCVDNFYECVCHECSFNPAENRITANNIRKILNEDLCSIALKNCNHNDMSAKSAVTYFLFRHKLAYLFLLTYRKITRRNPRKRKSK